MINSTTPLNQLFYVEGKTDVFRLISIHNAGTRKAVLILRGLKTKKVYKVIRSRKKRVDRLDQLRMPQLDGKWLKCEEVLILVTVLPDDFLELPMEVKRNLALDVFPTVDPTKKNMNWICRAYTWSKIIRSFNESLPPAGATAPPTSKKVS